jgi:hypothetical protein
VDETPVPPATPPQETDLKFEAVALPDEPEGGAAQAVVEEVAPAPPQKTPRRSAPRWRPKKVTFKETGAAPAPAPAPAPAAQPAPQTQSGFVPPPVSNPGF